VAVFGPGDPSLIGPRGHARVVIRPCEYRPCFDTCRKAEKAACLKGITDEDVFQMVRDYGV
jgi:hypothetical protein